MRRMRLARVVSMAVACALLLAGTATGQGGGRGGDQQGPQFLVVATSGGTRLVPLDVERAPILARRIALDLDGATLKEALATIAARAKLELLYDDELLPPGHRVRLRAERITVFAALADVLFGTGIDVVFNRGWGASLVRRSGPRPAVRSDTLGTVWGRVTAKENGGPLVGANVVLSLTDRALTAVTGDSGTFRITGIPVGDHQITVRYIGYQPSTKKVRTDSVPVRVDFALEARAVALNELVTTATGRQRRRDLGNAITTIKADSVMQHAPIHSLTDLLETRVPGLTVQHTSGAPGDPSRLRLRGLGSALRSNDPVVIVDGVRVYAAQSEARSGNLTNALGGNLNMFGGSLPVPSPLDQIDPNTIEKIEVFKGPSAATLYGADAANGVIVITTKRGKPGPTRWSVLLTHDRESSPGRYPVGYYRWGHDILNYTPRFCTLVDVTCAPDSLTQFQALNEPSLTVLGRGQRTGLSLTALGGSQALSYSVTGSYSDQLGLLTLPAYEVTRFQDSFQRAVPDWMRRPHHYEQWSVTSNVTARLSPAADLTLSTGITRSEQQRTPLETQLPVMSRSYVDTTSGQYYQAASDYILNPTSAILSSYYTRTTSSAITFRTGLNANWHPRPWFEATGQAGLEAVPRSDRRLLPTYIDSAGATLRGNGRSLVSTFNVQGTLRKPLGRGFRLETSLGANVNTTTTEDLASQATGLIPGTSGSGGAQQVQVIDAAANTSVFGWYIEPRVAGERLSLSAGLRLDGGSAYGTRVTSTGGGSGLAGLLALPKLNGSWVISEEPWFPFQNLFSSLRLRAAYGQAQVQPGTADRLRLYNTKVELTTLGNTQIRPERSREFEGGFDADLFDSRLSIEFAAYNKLRIDALMNVGLPGSVNGGNTSVVKNIGNILNRGVELTLSATPVRRQAVTWTAQLLFSANHNELTELGRGVERNTAEGLVEGYPVGGRWAKPIRGFVNLNGDSVIQLNEIQIGDTAVYVGQLYPAYTSALHTSVVLFGGAVGVTAGFTYEHGQTQEDRTAIDNWVLARPLVDPSAPASQQAAVIAYVASNFHDGITPGTSYGVIQRISTFRFNTLSVNYQAPARLAKLVRAERLSLAVQGSNLALHSSYRGKDPNVNAWGPGESIVDTGQLPMPRTWQVQVSLSY